MYQISVADAKQHLSDVLGRVAYGKERVTITRRGKPMAVLVPPEQVAGVGHLADARGWLEASDPFFKTIHQVVEGRGKHRPRAFSE